MIHWNTPSMVSAPLLPTIRCVQIVSSGATMVLYTAPCDGAADQASHVRVGDPDMQELLS
jgi:hypothetical protein